MFGKSTVAKRLAQLTRERQPTPERHNSFLDSIALAEQAKQQRFSIQSDVGNERFKSADGNNYLRIDHAHTSSEDESSADASPNVSRVELQSTPFEGSLETTSSVDPVQVFEREMGEATSFTFGFVSLSRVPMESGWLDFTARQLSEKLSRTVACLYASQSVARFADESDGDRETIASQAFTSEFWGLGQNAGRYASTMQSVVRRLPLLKSSHRILLIDLGSVSQRWVESLGRMCDSVYLAIPAQKLLSPSECLASVNRLTSANLKIRGSWFCTAAESPEG